MNYARFKTSTRPQSCSTHIEARECRGNLFLLPRAYSDEENQHSEISAIISPRSERPSTRRATGPATSFRFYVLAMVSASCRSKRRLRKLIAPSSEPIIAEARNPQPRVKLV
jgi:hypothetical protein